MLRGLWTEELIRKKVAFKLKLALNGEFLPSEALKSDLKSDLKTKQKMIMWHVVDPVVLQLKSVITNSMGPSVSVCYNREIVITVKMYVVK